MKILELDMQQDGVINNQSNEIYIVLCTENQTPSLNRSNMNHLD